MAGLFDDEPRNDGPAFGQLRENRLRRPLEVCHPTVVTALAHSNRLVERPSSPRSRPGAELHGEVRGLTRASQVSPTHPERIHMLD